MPMSKGSQLDALSAGRVTKDPVATLVTYGVGHDPLSLARTRKAIVQPAGTLLEMFSDAVSNCEIARPGDVKSDDVANSTWYIVPGAFVFACHLAVTVVMLTSAVAQCVELRAGTAGCVFVEVITVRSVGTPIRFIARARNEYGVLPKSPGMSVETLQHPLIVWEDNVVPLRKFETVEYRSSYSVGGDTGFPFVAQVTVMLAASTFVKTFGIPGTSALVAELTTVTLDVGRPK